MPEAAPQGPSQEQMAEMARAYVSGAFAEQPEEVAAYDPSGQGELAGKIYAAGASAGTADEMHALRAEQAAFVQREAAIQHEERNRKDKTGNVTPLFPTKADDEQIERRAA